MHFASIEGFWREWLRTFTHGCGIDDGCAGGSVVSIADVEVFSRAAGISVRQSQAPQLSGVGPEGVSAARPSYLIGPSSSRLGRTSMNTSTVAAQVSELQDS